ncbi:MAG TPA: zinc-binding dehydrogenase [Polyangiaceae bacterium]|nr:zinc-binding dehydrogenase [Polyangiaceae bacterium]
MRAILVKSIGGPEVLQLAEVPEPAPPAPGEVLVKIAAAGVNFADTERRRGIYAPPVFPWVPGREAAGVVAAVGRGVDVALVGTRVAYFSARPSGSYAEWATVPASSLFHFETELPFDVMASLPQQGLTAHGVLRFACIRPGQTVVVLAAAGGVGQILVQLSRLTGARVLGIVSTAEKRDAIAGLGAEIITGYDAFDEAVRAHTGGRGADHVFDSVGRATQAASFGALAPYGQLVYYGDASGLPEPIDVGSLYDRSLRVGAYKLDIERDAEIADKARRELTTALCRGALRTSVSKSFPLTQAAAAHTEMEARRTTGKIVLTP